MAVCPGGAFRGFGLLPTALLFCLGAGGCVGVEDVPRTVVQSARGFSGLDALSRTLREREAMGAESAARNESQRPGKGKRVIEAVTPVKAARMAPAGEFRCGAAEVDITPHLGLPMAGYSILAKHSEGVSDRLFARALVLEDARGERVALVFLDMMSASRYLAEKAAEITAPRCGIPIERLVLVGSHTHTGPPWYYGSEFYDMLAASEPGFDRCLSDWIAGRIATAIIQASDAAVPGAVVIGAPTIWGVSKNRSVCAFCENKDADQWTKSPYPGHGAPEGWKCHDVAVDPRVTVLAAVTSTGEPIAVFATFGCHATALGIQWRLYSADWPAHAARTVRERFRAPGLVVAVTASAEGDANALETVRFGHLAPGAALAQEMGSAVGEVIGEFVATHSKKAVPTTLDVRYGSWPLPNCGTPNAPLSTAWIVGGPTVAASEEGRSPLYPLFVREPMTGCYPGVPECQQPKVPGLGPVQAILRDYFDLEASHTTPFHLVRIGTHAFATMPGEPTAMAAYRTERAVLKAMPGLTSASVLACADDYGGYFATPEEFDAQHYEGSSTFWGRYTSVYMADRVTSLATSTPPPLKAGFTVGIERSVFRPADWCPGRVAPSPYITRDVRAVRLRWEMDYGTRIVFANGPLLVLEAWVGGRWNPVVGPDARTFDDVRQPVSFRRRHGWAPGLGAPPPDEWRCAFRIPEAVALLPLRVRVLPRDCFPGFVVPVPTP